ncbi:hypothetical protein COU59_03595 [Candidatus Pacearchaeota archaeon CG10_big_fil_rev_8_21_14_0_10_34_12]|nr:MAG: hypothetical protein COU59_03595 [Candidatus Pacearchaeota archaeon CG10_big_fil_rev_8_21_14_0_10_34_12]
MSIQDYTDKDIERLFGRKGPNNEEDLLMLQPDGTRACVGWELINGFHLVDISFEQERVLSDQELLKSAYKESGYFPISL